MGSKKTARFLDRRKTDLFFSGGRAITRIFQNRKLEAKIALHGGLVFNTLILLPGQKNGTERFWCLVPRSAIGIEDAIRQCAPAIRPKGESRDWNDYAQRTARYAYSAAGDRQVEQLAKCQQQWEKLEGRELQRQQEQAKAQKIERDNSPGMSR